MREPSKRVELLPLQHPISERWICLAARKAADTTANTAAEQQSLSDVEYFEE